MNLRNLWTEITQKPTGRLLLFLALGGIILAFFLFRRPATPRPDNREVPQQPATQAKGYTFTEEIPPPTRANTIPPAPPKETKREAATPPPKPPPPIPQAIFATREVPRSENFLPYGRLIRCELVNTVDSTNIATPIIGLVLEDVWHAGRRIIPAGTEVHGSAQNAATRERIGSQRQWIAVFQDGRELPLSADVLDYAPDPNAPDRWQETDGSAGLRGFLVKADRFAEAKAMLATMISGAADAFPETINQIAPLTGTNTQTRNGGYTDAFAAGLSSGAKMYSERLLQRLETDPYYVRVPGGTLFYLYVTQTVDLAQATLGLPTTNPNPANPPAQ
jgi:hypothetical protein